MSKIAGRLLSVKESATSGMAAIARNLKERGVDVINLSQGEPDFKTPVPIRTAAKRAIDTELYFAYPPTAGYEDLRQAIAEKYRKDNQVPYEANQVVISNGAKQALSNAILAICEPGDEVIIFAPFWVSHQAQVILAGATPILVSGDPANGFKVTAEHLLCHLTAKTKAIIFSSPCNPTGAVYHRSELVAIAEVVMSRPRIVVISDEVYEFIRYVPEHTSMASLPGMFDRTVTINGFSKGYAMTGWRVGYSCSPPWLAKEIVKLQGHLSSASCSIAQRAALSALAIPKNIIQDMVREYKIRRNLALSVIEDIPKISVSIPEGAFYLFPDVSAFYSSRADGQGIRNSDDFCAYILRTARVALVPGSAFGEDRCVRISYAAGRQEIKEAMRRIAAALELIEEHSVHP